MWLAHPRCFPTSLLAPRRKRSSGLSASQRLAATPAGTGSTPAPRVGYRRRVMKPSPVAPEIERYVLGEAKFWEVEQLDTRLDVRWGDGTSHKVKTASFPTRAAAGTERQKLIAQV